MKSKLVVFNGSQRFKYVGKKPYRKKKNGRKISLLRMQSYCPDCSHKYEVLTTKKNLKNLKKGSFNRRCKKCKQPGVPIPATQRKIFGSLDSI
jgi:hypothetical protein